MVLHYLMTATDLMTVTHLILENQKLYAWAESKRTFNFKDTSYTWCLTWHQSLWFEFKDTSNSSNLTCYACQYPKNANFWLILGPSIASILKRPHINIIKYVTFSSSNYASALCFKGEWWSGGGKNVEHELRQFLRACNFKFAPNPCHK